MTEPTAARAPRRILVVEDDPGIRALLETALRLSGYEVSSVATGRDALLEAERFGPALLVLDVMLPDQDGFALTRTLRAAGTTTPVLFLTARTDLDDRLAGLRAGGDDYVGKPFSIEEVLLRIGAVLRRTDPEGSDDQDGADTGVLRYADLELDETAHVVRRAGTDILLSPTEFRLLAFLMANAGRVVGKSTILEQVWGYGFSGDVRIIETYVKYLRRKIDTIDPPLIHTERGVGYCLRLPRDRAPRAEV
ncbi:response regulator transcription factor [Streptomyces sp. NPDC003247]|uniref:response regulator transcription factor n=1 Tax=Streptomyces sp. NPDC003247 TaxID=3364677 RepID=UPI00369BF96E